jgi:tripartite-type tricarboxylate transporter receptor subunit TctC
MRRRSLIAAVAAVGPLRPGRCAAAQDRFPAKPLRMVVPFAAGGSTDILARLCAQLLTDALGQTTVVENVTGAGGTLGAGRVLEAPADGHTLLAGTPGPITINPRLMPRIGYDPLRDFAPVAFVGDSPAVVVVRRDSPVGSVGELVRRAKAEPGKVTYASAGIGSFAHLSGALFEWRAGVQMVHVPYRGTAPAATDVMAGQVDVMFENYPSVQWPAPIRWSGRIFSGAWPRVAGPRPLDLGGAAASAAPA